MKANELIIGCWVTGKKWREKPFKITRINDSGKYYYGITAEGSQVGPFLIEELEPIPLTAEILEKNFPDPEIVCWYPDNNTYRIIIGDNVALNIKYVHELQHALRLCGIENEIEL